MIFYILLLILLIICVLSLDIIENLADNKIAEQSVPASSSKLPVKPDLSSNKAEGEYSNEMINNPERINKERQDVKENKSYSIQPKGMFFDVFDVNCSQPYKRPWACLSIRGNNVNNIPVENCETVCPENFEKKDGKMIPKLTQLSESFANKNYCGITEKNPTPSHYYCIAPCKKNACIKKKYNVFEPWKNQCGQNGFSQVPLNVYYTEKDCMEDNFPCNDLPKDKCLKKSMCGWCTNNSGQGFCFEGTTEGPLDPTIPCVPDREKATNAYIKGNENPFKGVQQDW